MVPKTESSAQKNSRNSKVCEVGVIQNQGDVVGLDVVDNNLVRVVSANEGILDYPWVKFESIEKLLNTEVSIAFTFEVAEVLSDLLFKYRSLDEANKLSFSYLDAEHGMALPRVQSVQIMRTDTILSVLDRQLRVAIVDCSTPNIYLFEIEYVDQIQAEAHTIKPKQLYHPSCHFHISSSESSENRRDNNVDLRDVTEAFCESAMEILNGCDLAIACKFLVDGSGDVISERIRDSATSTARSQLGSNYPSNFFASKDLLLKNILRIVYDVNSLGSRVYGYELQSLDLSQTKFCNPTDPCLQFLRKIGVQSAITIAIEVQGSLWGIYSIQSFKQLMVPTYEQSLLLEAAAANSALRIASIAREEFMSHMSHELRTPLHGVMTALQILQSDEISLEDRSNIVSCALECSQSLSTNLNDILTITRSNPKIIEQFTYVSRFCDLLSCITESFKIMANRKSVKLEMLVDLTNPITCHIVDRSIKAAEYILFGDKNQGSKIFQNLVNNAIKFTPEGGSVTIRIYLAHSCSAYTHWEAAFSRYTNSYVASQRGFDTCKSSIVSSREESGMYLVMEIEDTGCGVPQANMQTIFNAFLQLSSGINKTYQGIGLGLHIVRLHIDSLNGILGVCSTVGVGTLFYCAFPVKSNLAQLSTSTGYNSEELIETTVSKPTNLFDSEEHSSFCADANHSVIYDSLPLDHQTTSNNIKLDSLTSDSQPCSSTMASCGSNSKGLQLSSGLCDKGEIIFISHTASTDLDFEINSSNYLDGGLNLKKLKTNHNKEC